MQQFTKKENFRREEGLSQLYFAEVIVVAAKGNAVEFGQVIQHGQEVEGFRVPFSFIIGSDLVTFQELGDEGEIAQGFEIVAGVASELLEGGTIGFFFKHNCASSEYYFLCERLKRADLRKNQAEKRQIYNSKTIVRKMLKIRLKFRTQKMPKNS